MKKRNRNSTPAAQKKTKPAKVDAVDSHLESLEKEKQQLYRRPTILELAQLTAQLAASKEWNSYLPPSLEFEKYDPTVADAALVIWERCADALRHKIDEEINRAKCEKAPDHVEPPEWQWALADGNFPIPFEEGLTMIVGKKIRQADRHKAFRDFIRFHQRDEQMDEPAIETRVEENLARLKAVGFDEKALEFAGIHFDSWKVTQAKAIATKAAQTRWKKNGGKPLD
jgi:hypothetical protein